MDTIYTPAEFLEAAYKLGFVVKVTLCLGLYRNFTPGDCDQYCETESDALCLLHKAPLKGGSVWGSTSDGIGGAIALSSGRAEFKKSGTGKRWLKQLEKLIA